MKSANYGKNAFLLACTVFLTQMQPSTSMTAAPEHKPKVPKFSVDYLDKSVEPTKDFYHYAAGSWIKNNPVPSDKARWGSFSELNERNQYLIHGILETAKTDASAQPKSPTKQVGDLYMSAMDTGKIEQLKFKPIEGQLAQIDHIKTTDDVFKLLADFHKRGVNGFFDLDVQPDSKDSSIYALQLWQGGISLPDRDYYLNESFAPQRKAYVAHIQKMLTLLGETPENAATNAGKVLELETSLAKAGRTRVELRDAVKNYNKTKISELVENNPSIPWKLYLSSAGASDIPYAVVGQPEFFTSLDKLVKETPIADWKTYLRWQVLHGAAPFLHNAVETENFNFFGKTLSGQPEQEPRWKRSAKVIDRTIGEALGQLYVAKYFTPEAHAKMDDLVNNLRAVFRDRLQKLEWMSAETKEKALAKFDRFSHKIGYPAKFRDYSSIDIKPDDYLGNVQRASAFEVNRRLARIGKPVDRTEWEMTPPQVNAYFNPSLNEIVFPAGILQPPFFDLSMDDAVNYGAIGAVIGHEITHGYDDEGRKYDADGNLKDWWTEKDSKEFDKRAQKVIDEYDAFEALPGLHVNGKLTLGENIADLGGVTIAYDALQRALKKDPSKQKLIDGFTPEQRFFLSFAQIWRSNIRDAEQRRLITIDPHSPGQFRSVGPLMNFKPFYEAFNIKEETPMWREQDKRANIW